MMIFMNTTQAKMVRIGSPSAYAGLTAEIVKEGRFQTEVKIITESVCKGKVVKIDNHLINCI